jgi:hypothetical protein
MGCNRQGDVHVRRGAPRTRQGDVHVRRGAPRTRQGDVHVRRGAPRTRQGDVHVPHSEVRALPYAGEVRRLEVRSHRDISRRLGQTCG